jgi:hypothetical protein
MLAEGKVLYRDLLYFRGPLSPYWNSLWFVLFGPSLHTLVWVNLALLGTLMVVMYLVLRRASSAFAAFVAFLVFIFLFAFSQYVDIGNYNYVCPYSHEATHAMLLSWVTLGCLMAHARSGRIVWLAGAGLALGLVFLTKPEFFVADAAASVTALGLWVWLKRPSMASSVKSLSTFVTALLLPPFVAFTLLTIKLSWLEAAVGTLGGWWYLWHSRVSELRFFRIGMGIEAPWQNFSAMLIVVGAYASVLVPAGILAMVLRRNWSVFVFAVLEVVAVVAIAAFFWEDLPWHAAGRPLPLLLVILGVWNILALNRHREEKCVAALILVVFSAILLGKMLLHARLSHYGFALAMPATLVLVLAVFDWIPTAIKRRGGRQVLFYAVAVALFAVITARYVDVSGKRYALKSVAVGKAADTFLADLRGEFVKRAVEWLNRHARADETLAVLPEGIMINYLARLRNSTPIVTTIPSDILMFGEERILQLIKEAPPTYVALVHRDDTEYGYRFFGKDYGQSITHWLLQNYSPVQLIGALPLRDDRFGILIFKRKATPIE